MPFSISLEQRRTGKETLTSSHVHFCYVQGYALAQSKSSEKLQIKQIEYLSLVDKVTVWFFASFSSSGIAAKQDGYFYLC